MTPDEALAAHPFNFRGRAITARIEMCQRPECGGHPKVFVESKYSDETEGEQELSLPDLATALGSLLTAVDGLIAAPPGVDALRDAFALASYLGCWGDRFCDMLAAEVQAEAGLLN